MEELKIFSIIIQLLLISQLSYLLDIPIYKGILLYNFVIFLQAIFINY